MPTRKIFDLIVVEWVLLSLAWGIPVLWAHRKSIDPNAGAVSSTVAGAIETVHS